MTARQERMVPFLKEVLMTGANPLRSRVSGNDHARFWRRASTGTCARLASGYALSGRTLTLSLGKDAAGKQLQLVLELAEALPSWVNHQRIRHCRIVKEGHLYSVVFSVERTLANGKPLSPSKVVAEGIPVEIREWDCPNVNCSSHYIRDENAARNGLTRTRKRIGVALLGLS